MKVNLSEAIQFIRSDIWKIRRKGLSSRQSFLLSIARMVVLTGRGILDGRWQVRASAMTYYSLLSVVPALAFVFGIAKGFGFEKTLEQQIQKYFEGQEEMVSKVTEFAQRTLENASGGVIAGVGLLVVLYAVFRVLSQLEEAFNHIWSVNRSRKPARRITDYLALMIILPVFLIISSTATVVITSEVRTAVNSIGILGIVSPAISFMVSLLPYLALWVLFTYLYIFMPNTKVSFKSGALAGMISGTAFQLFQWFYINFQINISSYNAIYGTFSALPLFIFWLHISWLIVLLGAEISCAHQNVDSYEFDPERLNISYAAQRLLSLRVAHLVIHHFLKGERDLTTRQIARFLETPAPLIKKAVYNLVEAGVLSEVKINDDLDPIFQPARDPESMTIKYVIDALEQNGVKDIPLSTTRELESLTASLEEMGRLIEESPANKSLKNI